MELTREQKQTRATGIGGSEAAAALGLSNTVTRLDLYRHKVHGDRLPMYADEFALWLGHQLEPVAAACFERQTGMQLETVQQNFQHAEYPHMRGYIDRKVVGKNEGVELKAWSEFSRTLWGPDGSDDVPMPVLCQCVHYITITGFDCWHVGVLLGTEFRTYCIHATDKVRQMVIDGEAKFWQHVTDQQPPPAANLRDIHYLYQRALPDSARAATPEEVALHRELWQAKAEAKRLETQISSLEFTLKQGLKDTARLIHPDDDTYTLVNWRDHKRTVANTEALKRDGLWDAYSDSIATRPMLLRDPIQTEEP